MTAIFDFNYLNEEAKRELDAAGFSEKGSKRLCFHKDKDADLHAMLIVLKENALYEAHKHKADEMIYLQEGEIEIEFEDEIVKLKMTDKRLLIVEKGRVHSVKAGPIGAKILEVISHK